MCFRLSDPAMFLISPLISTRKDEQWCYPLSSLPLGWWILNKYLKKNAPLNSITQLSNSLSHLYFLEEKGLFNGKGLWGNNNKKNENMNLSVYIGIFLASLQRSILLGIELSRKWRKLFCRTHSFLIKLSTFFPHSFLGWPDWMGPIVFGFYDLKIFYISSYFQP